MSNQRYLEEFKNESRLQKGKIFRTGICARFA